jgi:hypothetical protein
MVLRGTGGGTQGQPYRPKFMEPFFGVAILYSGWTETELVTLSAIIFCNNRGLPGFRTVILTFENTDDNFEVAKKYNS